MIISNIIPEYTKEIGRISREKMKYICVKGDALGGERRKVNDDENIQNRNI